jgi:hypothetical protein
VPIFAADTTLARIVEWVTEEYDERVFGPVHDLGTMVVRRRPEGLRAGMGSILSEIDRLSLPDSETEAERLTMLFRILAVVVERVVRGDLRSPGPRVKPPLKWTDAEIEAEAARFVPREEEGLARLALTHDVVRRLLWERRWGRGAASPEEAVIAMDDASPLVCVLESLPYGAVVDGTRRGVFARAAYDAVGELVRRGLAPENDHAVWMEPGEWESLRRSVDPVVRLARSARRLLASSTGVDAAARVAMESVLVREPIRLGARFSDQAKTGLTEFLGRLDESARRILTGILDLERKASVSDANCALTTTRDG